MANKNQTENCQIFSFIKERFLFSKNVWPESKYERRRGLRITPLHISLPSKVTKNSTGVRAEHKEECVI